MAIFVPGMTCGLCGKPILESQSKVLLPPFVGNEADPLWKFSDGVFHEECFRRDSLANAAERRLREFTDRNKPPQRGCYVCQKPITHPDDYFPLGHLTDDGSHPLYHLNFQHFHRACLNRWLELPIVTDFATKQLESGTWKGTGMQQLINVLKTAKTESTAGVPPNGDQNPSVTQAEPE